MNDIVRDDDVLFTEGDLSARLRAAEQRVRETVDRIQERDLLQTPLDDLVLRVAEAHTVAPLELDVDDAAAERRECQIPIDRLSDARFRFPESRHGGPRSVPGQEVSYHVPFTGDPNLFRLQPSSWSSNPPHGAVRGNELVITFQVRTVDGPRLKEMFDREMQGIASYVRSQRVAIDEHNAKVTSAAKRLLTERVERIQQAARAADSLGVPLRRRGDAPTTYVAPEVRRKIQAPPAASAKPKTKAAASLEPMLPDVEYDHILKVMRGMALVLERSPSAFEAIGEEGIRWHFLVQLNGQYDGQATGETFNHKGKTDILVRSGDRNIFIAECKFWSGPQGFSATIDQLLGYLTWRDTKAAIVIFNRNVHLSTVLAKIPETLRVHPSCKSEVKRLDDTTFQTTLTRPDDAERKIKLTVMVFDVPSAAANST